MSQILTKPPAQDLAEEWAIYLKSIFEDKTNRERKAKSKELVDYYNDEQSVYLKGELAKLYGKHVIQDKRKWTQNILKKVMDALAVTYAGTTKRHIQNADKEVNEKVAELMFTSLNNTMSSVNKFLVR